MSCQCSCKPFEEMSAMFNGNEVKIRIPKHVRKPKFPNPQEEALEYMCTCGDQRECSPTCGQGNPESGLPGNRNQMVFQVPTDLCDDHRPLNKELVYCKTNLPSQNITPDNAPQGVEARKILDPDKDVFILKIGKQKDEPDRSNSIEVELVTPKAPADKDLPDRCCKLVQCGVPMCYECTPPCPYPCYPGEAKPTKKKKVKRRSRMQCYCC